MNIENHKCLLWVTGLFAAFFSSAEAATYAADIISFRDITGSVEIATTSGDEIDVDIRQGKKYQPITISEENGVVVITGQTGPRPENDDCCNSRIRRDANLRKGRKITTGAPLDEAFFADYPTIIVSMPVSGDVSFTDAHIKLDMERLTGALNLDACYVYGQTGDLGEAVLGVIDGSRLVVGNVAAGLEIDVSGDADVKAGNAAIVDVDIAGPGDVVLGDIDGMMDVSVAGSGIVRATRLDGPLTVRIAGSGGVAVKAGRADRLRATIDGSGGVYFGGAVHQPELRLFGSSEVRMKSVTGRVVRHGGGDVYVGAEVFSDD